MGRDGYDREVFRATCSCGDVIVERDARASNLPVENNREIAEKVVGAHGFTHEFKGEDYDVDKEWSA